MLFTVWDHRGYPHPPIRFEIQINGKDVTVKELHKRILANRKGCVKYLTDKDGTFISLEEYNQMDEGNTIEIPLSRQNTLVRQFFGRRNVLLTVVSEPIKSEELDSEVDKFEKELQKKDEYLSEKLHENNEDIKYLEFHNTRLSNEVKRLEKESSCNFKSKVEDDTELKRHTRSLEALNTELIKQSDSFVTDNMELTSRVKALELYTKVKDTALSSATRRIDKLLKVIQLKEKELRRVNENSNEFITELLGNKPDPSFEVLDKTEIEKMSIHELREIRDKIQASFTSDFNFIQNVIDKKGEDKTPPNECVICLDRKKDTVLIPCGHICICLHCSESYKTSCPICREKITTVQQIYQ